MNNHLTKLLGVLLFSVTFNIYATTPPAQIPQTGQTESYNLVGSDGYYQKGTYGTNATGRFVSGTGAESACITDKQTGLMWVKNPSSNLVNWSSAVANAAAPYCGYTDWRLPNRRELLSLVNYGQTNQATWLKSQGFGANVRADYYWSSTTYAPNTGSAWIVHMSGGNVNYAVKVSVYNNFCVWPVRGGQ